MFRNRQRRTAQGRTRGLRRAPFVASAASLLAMAALGQGCAGKGASNGSTRPRITTNQVATDPWSEMGFRLAWQGFPVLTGSRGPARVDVFDQGILVQDAQNTVTLMQHATGRNLWVTTVGRPLTRFVGNGVSEGRILVCTDNEIYFLDAQTGNLLDRQGMAVVVNTPPVVIGETAVFGAATGEVVGHSLYSGFKLWGYMLRGSIQATPVAIGPYVGAVSEAGDVLIVRPEDGRSTGRASIFGGLDNHPVADGRTLYVASVDQSIYAFAGDDGRRIWRYRTESPITAQPRLADGILYVVVPREGLVALDAISGERLWTNPDLSGEIIGSQGDEALLWDGRTLRAIDVESGQEVASLDIRNAQRVFCSPVENGDLFVVTRDAVSRYTPR